MALPLLRTCAACLLAAALPAASVGYISFGSNAQDTQNVANLDAVFGGSGWTSLGGGSVSYPLSGYSFLFIDGGTASGNGFASWLQTNVSTLEAWVSSGGRLFVDAGRSGGAGTIDAGFGGISFDRLNGRQPGAVGVATDPAHPIAAGTTGTWTAAGNTDFARDRILAPPGVGTPLITDLATGSTTLLELGWGTGTAWFGGFEATNMVSPSATNVLFQNMLDYMANAPPPNPAVPEPAALLLLVAGSAGLLTVRRAWGRHRT